MYLEDYFVLMLASASQARRKLLEQVGILHRTMVSGVNEDDFDYLDASKLVETLAIAKARAVALKVFCNDLGNPSDRQIECVLGCDSVFVFQNEIFAKPKNAREAMERWERMSSNSGFLMTGHALFIRPSVLQLSRSSSLKPAIQEVVTSRVDFEELTSLEIENYVLTGEPLQCAGGFALEGKGAMFIRAIYGCYSNVIGLSLPWLRKALRTLG